MEPKLYETAPTFMIFKALTVSCSSTEMALQGLSTISDPAATSCAKMPWNGGKDE